MKSFNSLNLDNNNNNIISETSAIEMVRKKFFSKGDVQSYLTCEHCDKVFKGSTGTVRKLAELHYRYSHGVEYQSNIKGKMGKNVLTNQLMDISKFSNL